MSAAKLISLPVDIWRNRVLRMLKMSEIVRLNSAVANHKDRSHFLFDIGTFHQALVLDGNEDERLRWCSEHRLFPTSVELKKSLEDDSCAWAEKVLSQVTQITFEGKSTCWEELIGYCTNPITHLSFRLCTLLDEESLLSCIEACPHLTSYTSYFNSDISHAFHVQIPHLCPLLREFECDVESTGEVVEQFRGNKTLTTLKLFGDWLSVGDLARISECLPNIENLQLITVGVDTLDAEVETFVCGCRKLRSLYLSCVDGFELTDASLASIATHLVQLETLTIIGDARFTEEGIGALRKLMPHTDTQIASRET